MTASLLLPVLALLLGFALARANTCTVASVERLALGGKADWLIGLGVAAATSGMVLATLALLGVTMDGLPEGMPLGWMPLVGGALIGLGAMANRACMLGSIAQLGRGNANYLLTLVGIAISLALFPAMVNDGLVHRGAATMPFMAGAAAQWIIAVLAVPMVFALYRALRHREHNWLYLVATGLAGGLLFALNPGWSYLSAIGRGVRGEWGGAALLANIAALCLFVGATLSLWLRDRLDPQFFGLRPGLGCLVGGLTMGIGAQLVPGGNDTLLLWTVPGLAWYGAVAYLSMIITVVGGVYACRWLTIRR